MHLYFICLLGRALTQTEESETAEYNPLRSKSALKLEPLLQITASPRSSKNACYFDSSLKKNTAKFVSYHHSEENYIEGNQ